jgi:Omp85 superfamily domain
MALFLLVVLAGMVLSSGGCATARRSLAQPPQPSSRQVEAEVGAGGAPLAGPSPAIKEEKKEKPQEEPSDEEDTLISRLLAAPEYLWEGMSYPFKRFAIFYERTDLMNRALDFFLNEQRTGGIYPRFALGGALSSGIGFTAFNKNLFHQQKEAQLRYLYATRGNQTADFLFRDPAVRGSSFQFETDIFWISFDDGRFFPAGNRAKEEDETRFDINQASWNFKGTHPVTGFLSASMLGRILVADAKGSSRSPQTPATVPGINTSVQAVAAEPSLTYDSRDSPFRPSTGWLLDTGFTFTEQVNRDQFRYLGYWVDIHRYIPVFRGNRVLLLRGYLTKLDSLSGQTIPFYELPLLDLNNGLRGFDRGRWQDKGALLFNVEWRYPVWKDIEGTIFLDEGQVFRDYRDLQLKLFQYSAGVGFRFVTARKFSFRVQAAASQDGVLLLIRGDLEFLRKRGTILGGF